MNNHPKSMHCDWGMMRDEASYDKTDGVPELRGRLDRIREGFEAATEAPPRSEKVASASERYEARAELFRLQTGFSAPGKDTRDGQDEAERDAAWAEWNQKNNCQLAEKLREVVNSYRREHERSEYPNGRGPEKWAKYAQAEEFRREYVSREPSSIEMLLLQTFIRLESAESESAGYGGRTPQSVGFWAVINAAIDMEGRA